MSQYRAVPPQVDLPALEREVLAFWADAKVFERTIDATAEGPLWVFYEGPPTANGMPGTHHVEARVFKDVFPRFKTMKGYHVPRKAGWDCHGLPVELAVEKELGFSGKGDIEAYGVAEFNARCRESVHRHVDAFAQMTERMGYWVDLSSAYWTMDRAYIESVWWSLAKIFDDGRLVQDHRVAPYCPRCGTGLSDHELAQGYETVVDPSVYVRFPLTSGPHAGAADLLVWTTTPWTLVSNTAVAARADVTYVLARPADGSTPVVVAEPLVTDALGEGAEVLASFPGAEMERWHYTRPFELIAFPDGADTHYVVLDDYVTTEDGTGLVHQAPAFGADDLRVCKAYGLPVVNPITSDGHFSADVPLVGGQFFKKADEDLVTDLQSRGVLFQHVAYEHAYPHCWRCHTALIYYAQPSWYIRTTEVKDELLRENERTNWYPDTIKHGRYGDWLNNNIDWALSRNRYWGTPLPIWRCEEGHLRAVASMAQLGELAGRDLSDVDPHRPYIDEVTFACETCGQEARRVPEVIDAWYDSGSMPFAQWGYPHTGREEFEKAYPAQFICEAIDQTRGWFYTLMAVGTLVFDRSSYENVLCLGHILAEDGRKMSKHLGNILEPMPLMDQHGADALRWFMACSGSPWSARRVGHNVLQEIVRKSLLTYWNTVAFQSLYARTAGFEPGVTPAPPVAERPALDRWAISEAHRLAQAVDAALEDFDTQKAGRLLAAYVDDLSNWYVRRNRRRFWAGDPAALATLHECLYVVTLLMAPITPFITERVWQDLFRVTGPELPDSVHLATWPVVDDALIDDDLAAQVALARRLVELGRAARADSGVKTRQPLSRALVGAHGWSTLSDDLRTQIAEELNVTRLESLADAGGDLVDYSAKANFRALGKRFGKGTQPVAAAIAAADPVALAADLRAGRPATIVVEGQEITVDADEVVITETPREGWSVAREGETVALDLTITPELRRAGLAREAVRVIQEARKTSGLEVADRIALEWHATGEEAVAALREHADLVAGEVLATSVAELTEAPSGDGVTSTDAELGLTFRIAKA
ncbi:isoleucine--tRNA ligase [Sporichthya polymorpha]|uniref:isoleucine--tRNA ligase n=1 Tax=Sporichthya polymorpha TaxID=35751 RepID=UPI000366308B|nr:isoleucine--tRNA ligase [Sporichthya polymorpha]